MESAGYPYRVVEVDRTRGRACVATRSLLPGEVVLAEWAVACVGIPGRLLCDDCLTHITTDDISASKTSTRGSAVHQCLDCRSLFGGSSDNGSSNGSNNSNSGCIAQGLSSVNGMRKKRMQASNTVIRLSAKILYRRCSGLLGHEQARIDSLMHHHDEQEEFGSGSSGGRPEEDEEDCVEVAKLAARMYDGGAGAGGPFLLLPSGGLEERSVPSAALLDLARKELGRVSLNTITACDGMGAMGLGLFPSGAMFNHSCSPNCQAWWRGSKLEIRCTKPVSAGEELCFSYIPIDQPSTLRRAQLRHSWFFTCHCRRCVSGRWDAELAGLRCPVAGCLGSMPPPPWSSDRVCSGARCNRCGSSHLLRSAPPHDRGKGSRGTTIVALDPPSLYCDGKSSQPAVQGKEGEGGGGGVVRGTPRALLDYNLKGCEERLQGAATDCQDGMEAYMREEPEVALVALEKSLLVRESLLHPFNKELLRTLRYASYAAIATHSWAKASSFLSRWLHPMDVMFGAAEVWDIAAMRIDAGLVLDKLSETTTVPGTAPPPAEENLKRNKPPAQPHAAGGMHPAVYNELAAGLRWIWICLGRDSGLQAETAALESFADHGVCFNG